MFQEPSEDEKMKEFIANGEKINAVKRYREITGEELKKASEYVDKLMNM